jgi:3-dehydroquinate synthase
LSLWHDAPGAGGRRQGAWLLLDGLREFREHLGGHLCVTMPRGVGAKFEVHDMSHDQIIGPPWAS